MLWVLLVNKLLVPIVALSTGCVGLVVPPMKLSGAAGPALGRVERDTGELEPESATTLRAGFHPLSLLPQAPSSPFDAGVGYGGDVVVGHARRTSNRRTTVHGPYLEGAYYPVRRPAGSATFRWGLRANVDVLFLEPRSVTGYGGTLVTELEIGGFVAGAAADGDGDDGGHAGDDDETFSTAFGSWSLGAFAGGSARSFPGSGYAGLTAGLSVRVPFLAAVTCCAWPGAGDSDGDSDSDGNSGSSPSTSWRLPKRRHETRPASPVRSSPAPSRSERIPTPNRDELKR